MDEMSFIATQLSKPAPKASKPAAKPKASVGLRFGNFMMIVVCRRKLERKKPKMNQRDALSVFNLMLITFISAKSSELPTPQLSVPAATARFKRKKKPSR
jgi:hypothetical protein